jgi:serine/threonine-protein kinase
LTAFGAPGGPTLDEALRLFADLRKTPDERRAIDRLLACDARAPLPDPLLVHLAAALLDRGDVDGAKHVLARSSSSPALMMRADLAARAGDHPGAVALVERVLAQDIDWPGAGERRARWIERLELRPPRRPVAPWETVALATPDAPFELLREVGRGGAGAVYEATDRALGRRLALKLYHQPNRDRAQLLHEARVAVALSGPGIVRVFDVDPEHGWLAMEWAALGPLSALLRTRDIEPLTSIERWALPLAVALAWVHAAGWVHHDVKPANVLVRAPNAPILSDFGTARRVGEPSPPGSPGYVSPERLSGRASDPRDDVYGFGRILEDALVVLGNAARPASLDAWRSLAADCKGPDDRRPATGAELAARTAGAAADSWLTT